MDQTSNQQDKKKGSKKSISTRSKSFFKKRKSKSPRDSKSVSKEKIIIINNIPKKPTNVKLKILEKKLTNSPNTLSTSKEMEIISKNQSNLGGKFHMNNIRMTSKSQHKKTRATEISIRTKESTKKIGDDQTTLINTNIRKINIKQIKSTETRGQVLMGPNHLSFNVQDTSKGTSTLKTAYISGTKTTTLDIDNIFTFKIQNNKAITKVLLPKTMKADDDENKKNCRSINREIANNGLSISKKWSNNIDSGYTTLLKTRSQLKNSNRNSSKISQMKTMKFSKSKFKTKPESKISNNMPIATIKSKKSKLLKHSEAVSKTKKSKTFNRKTLIKSGSQSKTKMVKSKNSMANKKISDKKNTTKTKIMKSKQKKTSSKSTSKKQESILTKSKSVPASSYKTVKPKSKLEKFDVSKTITKTITTSGVEKKFYIEQPSIQNKTKFSDVSIYNTLKFPPTTALDKSEVWSKTISLPFIESKTKYMEAPSKFMVSTSSQKASPVVLIKKKKRFSIQRTTSAGSKNSVHTYGERYSLFYQSPSGYGEVEDDNLKVGFNPYLAGMAFYIRYKPEELEMLIDVRQGFMSQTNLRTQVVDQQSLLPKIAQSEFPSPQLITTIHSTKEIQLDTTTLPSSSLTTMRSMSTSNNQSS